jgi:hypothetical protein
VRLLKALGARRTSSAKCERDASDANTHIKTS